MTEIQYRPRKALREDEADAWVRFLNEVHERDPEFLKVMIETRFPCAMWTAHHPTIQVATREHEPEYFEDADQVLDGRLDGADWCAGFLGFLNGYLGAYSNGYGPVCVVRDQETRQILRFDRTPNPDAPPPIEYEES